MKYLIISDASSMHVYNYIKNMLFGRGYDIYILTHSVKEIPKEYLDYYKENNITVYSLRYEGYKNLYGRNKLNVAIKFFKKALFMRRLGYIDICQLHYVHRASLLLIRLFRKRIGKVIFSYWGSDILQPSSREVREQKRALPLADVITVTVKNSYNVFRKRFGSGYDSKLRVVHFAAGGISGIKQIAQERTKEQCRAEFLIPDGKLMVVCGYNADPSQRQEQIAQQLAKLGDDIKSKLHLVVPLQYNRVSAQYIQSVKEAFSLVGCSYSILEDYVSFERNAIMSLATDIYLNLRISDAFSNAMKEQVCAGSYLVTGTWLNYIELDECNAPVTKIAAFDELPRVIEGLVNNYKFPKENIIFEPFYRMFATENVREEWDKLLDMLEK